MHGCTHARVHACIDAHTHGARAHIRGCMHVSIPSIHPSVHPSIHTFIHMYVRMYACTYVRMHVCAYVRMCVCTYVRMYVCTYVCMFMCVWTHSQAQTKTCGLHYVVAYLCTNMTNVARMWPVCAGAAGGAACRDNSACGVKILNTRNAVQQSLSPAGCGPRGSCQLDVRENKTHTNLGQRSVRQAVVVWVGTIPL